MSRPQRETSPSAGRRRRRLGGAALVAAAIAIAIAPAGAGEAGADGARFRGPLPVRQLHPLHMPIYDLPIEAPDTVGRGSWRLLSSLAESNSILDSLSEGRTTMLFGDLETSRLTLEAAYGVGERVELAVAAPLIARWGGFLDPVIEGAERLVGQFNPVRDQVPDNDVRLVYVRDGATVVDIDNSAVTLGDVSISAKVLAWRSADARSALAARVGVELPTGNDDELLGGGGTDLAAALDFGHQGRRLAWYLHGSFVSPDDALAPPGLETRSHATFAFALEVSATRRLSVLGQLAWYASPFEDGGVEELDQNLAELTLGVALDVGEGLTFKAGGVENLILRPAADFSLLFTIEKSFGPAAP